VNISPGLMSHFVIQSKMATLLRNQNQFTLLLIGLLNGLLPCGLVYIALSGALVSETLSGSVWFMFLFGLGTMPYLFLITYFGQAIRGRVYKRLRKFIPVLVVLLGVLFILRGLNLGIPYISPKLNQQGGVEQQRCH
jgi:sulfite exporter TauE/SafE